MRYCTKCGQPVADDGQRFCTNCGAPLEIPTSGTSGGRAAAPHSPAPEEEEPPVSAPAGQSGDRNPLIPILIAVAAVCILLGIGARILAGRSGEGASAPSSGTSSASQSQDAAGQESQEGDPWTDGVEPAQPEETQRAEASDTQVVFRNVPANATLTVDGKTVTFSSVGEDAVVSRDSLPDVCIVRAIVPTEGGGWQTAAAWYNESYGNDLTLGDPDQYGAYTDCDETGLCQPSYKLVDVLTWAYYTGYLECINNQTMEDMVYSTQANTADQQSHVFSQDNAKNEYDLGNYQAVCQESSIQYSNGLVRYNGSFVTYATNRETGLQKEISNHRTIELAWEDGMWKVNRIAFLSDEDYNAGRYAQLP